MLIFLSDISSILLILDQYSASYIDILLNQKKIQRNIIIYLFMNTYVLSTYYKLGTITHAI